MQPSISLLLVVFLGLLTAVTPLATDMYLPSLPIMPQELDTTASAIQMTIGIMIIGIAIGQLIGGPISDMWGRKKPLIIGNILCVLATLVCAFAPSIEILLLGRFLQGVTGSIGVVIAKAIARDYTSGQELMKLFSMLMMVNGLAPVIAPLIGGQILLYATWRFVFIILAIFTAILVLGSLLFKESLPPESRVQGGLSGALQSYKDLLKDPAFLGQCGIQFFAFGSFFCYISGSAFVYQNIFQLNAQEFSYIFGINSCGIILFSTISSRLSNVISTHSLLRSSLYQLFIGSLAFLIAMLLEAPFLIVTILLFLTVGTVSLFGASSFSIAMSNYGHVAGSASALLGFFSMICAGIVSPLVGIAGPNTAVPMGITMTIFALGALFCYYRFAHYKA